MRILERGDYLQAPSQFYVDNNIPKVRWMYSGKAYKARLITVSRKLDAAKMFVYVLDDKYLIAFRDKALTNEIGMMKLEHFELFGHLNISEPPTYSSRMPISLKYGQLLDSSVIEKPKSVTKEPENVTEKVETVTIEEEVKVEPEVKVTILPPDPPAEYEQMELALF